MSDHVSLELADFLEDRITPERRHEMERHIEICAECAAEVAFAIRFRENAMAQGLAHLRPERIVTLAASPEAATPIEQHHLGACAACRAEITWAGTAPTGGGSDSGYRDDRLPGGIRLPRLRLWLPATAAVAVLAALFFLVVSPRLRSGAHQYAGLILAEPLPVRISRSSGAADPFESARLLGLEAYRDRDYVAARARFGDALTLGPRHAEMLLYAGSTELLLGNAGRAAALLETGLRH
ncbi:MAG: hypothetical protein FD129_2638, partial [bacterium]